MRLTSLQSGSVNLTSQLQQIFDDDHVRQAPGFAVLEQHHAARIGKPQPERNGDGG